MTTDEELFALTADQLEQCLIAALRAGDLQAAEGYLLLMTRKDLARAGVLFDALGVGLMAARKAAALPTGGPA